MEQLLQQIKQLLSREKKFLYQIYEKIIRDHAYLWEELEDLEKLRQILLVIIKLFIEEHKNLKDLSQLDQEELARDFRRLLSSKDALLQKGRQHQIDEIEAIGIEQWIELFWTEINKINKLIEFYERYKVPERVTRGLTLNGGKQYRKMWLPEHVRNYTLQNYIEKMKESSGHFAVHAIPRPDLFLKCVKRGYIKATGMEDEKPKGYMAAESEAVHFSVDKVYWRGISQGGFFCAVEALLENKAFMDSPLKENNSPNEDWPLGGFSKNPDNEANKFYFNDLGILILPREINESLSQQYDMTSGAPIKTSWAYNLRMICKKFDIEDEFFPTKAEIILPTTSFPVEQILRRVFEKISKAPKKVYFYKGDNLEDGIKELILKFGLQPKKDIVISGSIKLVRKSPEGKTFGGAGRGDFFAVRNT